MKLYTPPEMSKKLVALGCVSQSRMTWGQSPYYGTALYYAYCPEDKEDHETLTPAFEFEDFAGPSDAAMRNARIIWGHDADVAYLCPICDGLAMRADRSSIDLGSLIKVYPEAHHRHALLFSKNWVEEVGRGL